MSLETHATGSSSVSSSSEPVTNSAALTLENSPPEVQLAVDLIYLLECNEIDPQTAVAALEIVLNDFRGKCENSI